VITFLGILFSTIGLCVCVIGFSHWFVQTFDIDAFVNKFWDHEPARGIRYVPKGTHKMIHIRTDFIVKLHTPTHRNWCKRLRFKG
jgi:hypothetical protein